MTKNEINNPVTIEKRKSINKKILKFGCLPIGGILLLLMVIGIFADKKTPQAIQKTTESKIDNDAIPPGVIYKIVKVETDEAISKREVIVELNNRVDIKVLEQIAYKVKGGDGFKKNWIFYHLPNHSENEMAWAISHFTPELDLQIMGTTIEQEKMLKNGSLETGEIVGKWKDQISMLTIYREDESLKLKTEYKDGSSGIDYLKKSIENEMIRYDYVEDTHGEYFVVEYGGNLGMYGNDGKFGEAEFIK